MMLGKNRSHSVGLVPVVICTLSAAVFSGCCPASGNKAGQAAPSKEGTGVKPGTSRRSRPPSPPNRERCWLSRRGKIGSDAAEGPKVSTFAPAADLASQADRYIKELEGAVASEEEYKDDRGQDRQGSEYDDCHRLGLGLHDQENKYQANAGAVMKAAQAVAATKDFASAKKAVAALRKRPKARARPTWN